MKSSVTIEGVDYDISVKYGEYAAPAPEEIGVPGANLRWVGTRVRLKSGVVAMMKDTESVGQFGTLINPHTASGALPLTLVSRATPSEDDEYIITGIRTASASTTYQLHAYATPEERRTLVRVFELTMAVAPGCSPIAERDKQWMYSLVAPTNCVEVVSLASKLHKLPEPGIDFIAPQWMVTTHEYRKIDQRCEGFTNRPTAKLAKAFRENREVARDIEKLRDDFGNIHGPALVRMSFEKCWETLFLKEEDFLTPGFPRSFRLSVNYTELASVLNAEITV